jgi:molybdopterin molybdotransferase
MTTSGPMISVDEATQIILDHSRDFGTESVPLSASTGRVLQHEILADRDFPPFDRVSMDGIAIAYQAYAAGRRSYAISGLQAAGAPQQKLPKPEACLEVMTGAILPEAADTVIPYEQISIAEGQATVRTESVKLGQNAHRQGFDRKRGDVLVPANTLISPAEIGLAATVGLWQLRVARLPKIAIFSTGDELVGVEDEPAPHQIRASNIYTIASVLSQQGIAADCFHLPDEESAVRDALARCLEHYDALIISGGVSKGKRDFVPAALAQLDVHKYFYRVAQRPGKPFWFGQAPQGATVFALPGNPLAALACTLRYTIPWIRQSLGQPPLPAAHVPLSRDFQSKSHSTYFLLAYIGHCVDSDAIIAYPAEGQGSGDLASLAKADGFLELPEGREHFLQGELFRFLRYRPPFGSTI